MENEKLVGDIDTKGKVKINFKPGSVADQFSEQDRKLTFDF